MQVLVEMSQDLTSSQTTWAGQRSAEVHLLQNLKDALWKAKQELNTDLTRLAVRNLPLMKEDFTLTTYEDQQASTSNQSLLQPSSIEDNKQNADLSSMADQQTLEPLDLDV